MRYLSYFLLGAFLVALGACAPRGSSYPITVNPDPIGTVPRAGKTITVSVPTAPNGFKVRITIRPGSNGYSSSIQADSSVHPPILGGTDQTKTLSAGTAQFVILGTANGDDKILIEVLKADDTATNSVEKSYETTG